MNITKRVKSLTALIFAIVCACSLAVSAYADAQNFTPELGDVTVTECVASAEGSVAPELVDAEEVAVSAVEDAECITSADDKMLELGEGFKGEVAATAAVKGDVNGDGAVNVADAAALSAHVKGIRVLKDDSNADVNGDGVVNVSDLSLVTAAIKGLVSLN